MSGLRESLELLASVVTVLSAAPANGDAFERPVHVLEATEWEFVLGLLLEMRGELEELAGERPRVRVPLCLTTHGGSLIVACDDGSVWFWGPRPPLEGEEDRYKLAELRAAAGGPFAWPHTWIAYHSAIPGTYADRDGRGGAQ